MYRSVLGLMIASMLLACGTVCWQTLDNESVTVLDGLRHYVLLFVLC